MIPGMTSCTRSMVKPLAATRSDSQPGVNATLSGSMIVEDNSHNAADRGPLPSTTVIGNPDRFWKMPLSLHPPRIASTRPDASDPYARPRPNGSS